MGVFRVELEDGRVFDVEADSAPTPEDILAALPPITPAPEPEAASLGDLGPDTGFESMTEEELAEVPGRARETAALTAEVGLPVLGGITAGPAGAAGGGAAGSVIGDLIRGEEVSGRKLAANAAISAIPGGRAARTVGSVGKRLAAHAVEGGVIGGASAEVSSLIQEGELAPLSDVAEATAAGAAFGGLFGTLVRRPAAGGAVDELNVKVAPALDEARPEPVPPLGKRQVLMPDEERLPPSGEQLPLFYDDAGHLTPEIVPVLEQRMTVPVSDAIRDDFKGRLSDSVAALSQLPENVQKQRFFRQLNAAVQDDLLDLQGTSEILTRSGYSLKDFMQNEFLPSVSKSGQTLNRLSQMKKSMLAQAKNDPELRDLLDAHAVASGEDSPFWRLWREVIDLDDVGRTAAIGQMATAHRNAVTQFGRLILEVPVDGVQKALEAAGSKMGGRPAGNPLATITGLFHAMKPKDTERVLAAFEGMGVEGEVMARRFFGTSIAETAFVPGKTGRPFRGLASSMAATAREGWQQKRMVKTVLGPLADAFTAYNQLQENFFRRAALHARLQQRAEQRGLSWQSVIDDPKVLDAEDFNDALSHSLQVTFAESPQGELGKRFVSAVKLGQPFTTLGIPYPRYMVNFGKFFLDFNPVGMLRLARKSTRDQRGNEVLAKGIVGSMMLGAAYGIRTSEHAGENWYEVKDPRDPEKRINVVGLAGPFLPYLFMAELFKRKTHGDENLKPLTTEDYVQGSAGIRLSPSIKAGFDLWSDQAPAEEKFPEFTEKVMSEWAGRFTVPLRTVKSFAQAYGYEREGLYYDPREVVELDRRIPGITDERGRTKALASTIQNVPGLGTKLDRAPSVSLVTGKERTTESPLRQQLLGATTVARTPVGNELERIGLTEYDLAPRSGIPKADREIARRVGILVQKYGPNVLSNDKYLEMPRSAQVLVWKNLFKEWRKAARNNLKASNAKLAEALKLKAKFSKAEKRALKEYGQDIDEAIYQIVQQAPEGSQRDDSLRADGTPKGQGWLGPLQRPDGGVSTELSIGVEVDGEETEIPSLVPTLTKKEVDWLLAGNKPTDAIVKKAIEHARPLLDRGESPFAPEGP